MTAYCLPPKFANAFLNALKAGNIDPAKLMGMSSGERNAYFAKIVGEDHAGEVNALFESKLLLKDKQAGLVNWAKKIAGITEERRSDILDKISKMDKILGPMDEQHFLADLAAQKLGTSVTASEAKEIFDLSKVAEDAKATMLKDLSNPDNRIAYGRAIMDLRDKIESLKPNGRTFSDKLIDALNVPKSMLTSILHFSAPFVQGWGMISTARAWEGFGQMFKYFADEENYKNLNAYIISHPDYPLAKGGGLGLTQLGEKLTAREEAIQSSLVEQANQYLTDKTGVPNLVRASSRAFTGYLNYVRFNRFTDLVNAARLSGEDVSLASSVPHDLAKVVNDFTGRGAIGTGDRYANVAPALNAVFFSPRKISATINMFNPVNFVNPKISLTARKAAVRQLSGSILATAGVLGLAKAMGASVDIDSRSSNFAKIQIGGEKLDMTGGNAIYSRLIARIISNQEVTSNEKLIDLGKGYKPITRADLILQYTRGKLSPVAGALADALYGTDPVGRPFSVTQEMRDKLVPITMNSFINFAMNDPNNTAAILPALSAIFGVGLESPLPGVSKRDVWGETSDKHDTNSPVDARLNHLGIYPNAANKNIRGVKLSDDQYDQYQQIRGRLMKGALTQVLNTKNIDAMPAGAQERLLRETMSHATEYANTKMMMLYPGLAVAAQQAKAKAVVVGTPAAIERRR